MKIREIDRNLKILIVVLETYVGSAKRADKNGWWVCSYIPVISGAVKTSNEDDT
jgi:hypothetical protein